MRTALVTLSIGIWLIAFGVSLPAAAIEPDIRCQANKVSVAGKYYRCWTKSTSKAVKRGLGPFRKCDSNFISQWAEIETEGAGSCPTSGDETLIRASVRNRASALTALLGGEPLIPFPGLPATGQVSCWDPNGDLISCSGTGHDGDTPAGAVLTYQDNDDGTILDLNTGLTWEKLSRDRSIHDYTHNYSWEDAFAVKIRTLNRERFAGRRDWRLPNVKELQSIVHYERSSPAVARVFDFSCLDRCTVLTCSCTQGGFYWSSSSYAPSPDEAWYGIAATSNHAVKRAEFHVRAVHGP